MENIIYDTNASIFIESWLTANMKSQYDEFECLVKPGAKLLDGGCGSGRDTLYFLQKGYSVRAFDPSEEMSKYASSFTGIRVDRTKWEDLDEENVYDGIWASASLYHVKREDMEDVFARIAKALKQNGVLFCSFRDRPDDFSEGGRSFTSFDKNTFTEFLDKIGLFDVLKIEERKDTRKDKADELWLYAFLRKK